MSDALAERLLAQVMGWTTEDVVRERPLLQALAAFKYDEYQQFSPGMRFIESLACWLDQFPSKGDRAVAYDFVVKQLVFFSTAEINHLVAMSYTHCIRPLLLQKAATEASEPAWRVGKVANSDAFKRIQRQCLFLGLSDGARMDLFRRDNPGLSHEQVLTSYEVPDELAEDLGKKLHRDVGGDASKAKFGTVVLVDDFSASGTTYLRKEEGRFQGKIAKFFERLPGLAKIIDASSVEIVVLLYIATDKAVEHLNETLRELASAHDLKISIEVVHPISHSICLARGDSNPFSALLEKYYKPELEDEHTRKGGTDIKYGYAGCGLPLVLAHNTPNNSVFLLWETKAGIQALFPRVKRHK